MGERSPKRRAPGAVPVVGVSLAALAAGTFVSVGIGVLAPELQADFGFSRTGIGVLIALVSVGASLASRRAGKLTDSLGPAPVLAGSLVVLAVASGVAAVAPVAGLLMVAVFFVGLAYGGLSPPTNVVVAGQMSSRLGLLMSLKQTGVPVGGFLAGLVMPPVALALDWRVGFGLAALVAAAVAASTVWLRGASVLRSPGMGGAPATIDRSERLTIAGYGFVMAGTQWVFLTYLVLYLTERQGWSLRTAGLALSVGTASSVAGRLFWGWLSDRPGRRVPALLATSGIAAAMLSLVAGGIGGAALWPVAAATGAALVGWNGVFHALVTDRASSGSLGKVSGEIMSVVFAGSVCLPPLFGLISEQLDSWTLLWALAAGAVALAAIGLWIGVRGSAAAAAAPTRSR